MKQAVEADYGVCFSYVSNNAAARKVLAEVENMGGIAMAVKSDVAVENDVLNLFATADQMDHVSGLANNAGIVDLSKRVERMYAVNVAGSIVCP